MALTHPLSGSPYPASQDVTDLRPYVVRGYGLYESPTPLYAVLIMLLELNYGHQVYSTVNGIVNTLKHNTTCHLNKVGMRG